MTLLLENGILCPNLSETSLVDEFLDGFSGWVSEGDVWLDSSQQVGGSLVYSDENSVVDLSQSQQSEDSDWLGIKFVNTSDSDNKG